VSVSAQFLSPSEAARQLGVSAKAVRLYEQRGLVAPVRSAAGWRAYGPGEMARAAEIVALRALGLSLAQVARVLGGAPRAWSLPWPRTRQHLRARSARLPAPSRGFAHSEPALPRARRLPPEIWLVCWEQFQGSASRSISPGPGAANGSSCAMSGH